MKWIDFPSSKFEVCGLPFFNENRPDLYRFPKKSQKIIDDLQPDFFDAGKIPCGGRIRFATDSSELHIKLRHPHLSPMNNMCRFGQAGLDTCIDGQHWNIVSPKEEGACEYELFSGVDKHLRQACLYLPIYAFIDVLAIGSDDCANFVKPAPFDNEKPVVFYGSSITQGGCASRPSLSYAAILGKQLNLDFVNFGFSGRGKGESALAEIIATVPVCCYVMDFAVNVDTPENLAKVYYPFIEIIHSRNPHTPMICITPIPDTTEFYSRSKRDKHNGQRQVIREAVATLNKKAHRKITLVEGPDLLAFSYTNATVDGCHPNDLGFLEMAKNLAPIITNRLKEV